MRPLLLLILCTSSASLLLACEGTSSGPSTPPVPEEVTSAVNNSVQLALTGAAESFEFLNDSELADELFDLLPGDESDCVSPPMIPDGEFDDSMDEFVDDPCGGGDPEGADFQLDFKDTAQEMADWVADEVLTDEHVEEVSGSAVIYLLPTNLLCDALADDSVESAEHGMPPEGAPMVPKDFCISACGAADCDEQRSEEECASLQESIAACMESCLADGGSEQLPSREPTEPPAEEVDESDTSCEEVFEQVPLRLRVTAFGAGHKIDLLVGEQRSNPISALVAPSELAFELDMGGSMETLEIMADAVGEDAPELPETLVGRVKLALKKNAVNNYTAALSVIEAVHLVLKMDGDEISFQLGASDPTLAITADGDAKALSLDVDVAAIDLALPGSVFAGETCEWDPETGEEYCETDDSMSGDLDVHLGGASASMALTTEDDDSFTVTNAGLGDTTTTVKYDGQQIIGVDLNPAHGRRLDLSIASLEDVMELAVDPALVLKVALSLANAPDMAEDAPPFMLDEEMTLSLTGSNPTVAMGDDGMRVVSGTLMMSSTSLDDVVVEAGMCMEVGEDAESEESPWEEPSEEPGDEGHPFASMKATECN